MTSAASSLEQEFAFLASGGEMGKAVRAKDWSRTPLGPIDSWPQSLRTTVSLALASNFPIAIAWGPDRTQIYNDGYWPICGAKHPHSMGQDFKECWFSAWPAIGEAFESASAGKTAFLVNQRMFLDRYGFLEETFFTFSFSPIRDETGAVVGLFHPVTELTQQTLAERRLQVLRDLADQTAEARSVAEACKLIERTLRANELDVPFALLYVLDGEGTRAVLQSSTGLEPGSPASPSEVDLQTCPANCWPLGRAAANREMVTVENVRSRVGKLACGPYPEPPHTAFVLPITLSGVEHTFAVLVAGVSSRRQLDDPYRTFYSLLRDAVASALTNARAYEEERKRAEALAELDRAKTAFFSNVSHEFRTPLTLMLGPLEDLLQRSAGVLPGPATEQLELVHRNSLRLLKLVNTMLDFSRIEAGRIQANYEPVDLSIYTSELASSFRAACERAGLRFIVNCPALATDQPVYVDRDMWEKIVLNLISNAFKFTLEGDIEVRLDALDRHVQLIVRDTGVGIPPDELPRMFERFHRIKHARSRTHEGTGIGLALVQELVKLHGGSVQVASEVDRGSQFIVTIPTGRAHLDPRRISSPTGLAPTATGASAFVEEAMRWLPGGVRQLPGEVGVEAAMNGAAPGVQSERARILWADDNADMRAYVERLLSERFEVESVPDGLAALAAARARLPDLVLSDIMMPNLDGFGLLQELRKDAGLRSVPVILLSARAGEESRVEGLEAGADDYLIKPFSARELFARVDAHIKMARLRRESQAALQASEERFRLAQSIARVGTFECDLETGTTTWTPDLEAMHGLPPGAFAGTHSAWTSLIHPEDRERALQVLNHSLESGEPTEAEWRVVWPDGTIRWLAARWQVLKSSANKPLRMTGVNIDISDRKMAEQALRRQSERAALLSSTLQELLAAKDPDTIVRELFPRVAAHVNADAFFNFMVNESASALRLHACAGIADEVVRSIRKLEFGQAICGRVALGRRPIHAADIQRSTDEASALVRSLGIQAYFCNPLLVGDQLLGTLSFASRARARFEPDELEFLTTVSQYVAVAMHRLHAEQSLRESERRFKTMADTAPAMLWVTDPLGACTFLSHGWHEYSGQSEEQSLGFGWLDAVHTDDRGQAREIFLEANRRREPFSLDYRLRRADGEYRWAVDAGRPRFDSEERFLGYIGSVIDIHERRLAEEVVSRSQRLLLELIERAPFGVYIVDAEMRVAQMNSVSQAGAFRNVRPVIGRDLAEAMRTVWPELVAEAIVASFRRTLLSGEPYRSARFVNRRRDIDAIESYEWELHRLTLADGRPGVICYFFDSIGCVLRKRRCARRTGGRTSFLPRSPTSCAIRWLPFAPPPRFSRSTARRIRNWHGRAM